MLESVIQRRFDFKMRRLVPALVVVLGVVVAGAWLFINLRAKRQYDLLRDEVAQKAFSVVPMDQDTRALLARVRSEWEEPYTQVGGPTSESLEIFGLRPCVANLVEICSRQMPDYCFVSPSRNKWAAVLGIDQLVFFAPSMDQSLHVSDDGHVALMRCGTNCVYVFSDEAAGLRETLYRLEAEKTKPENSGDRRSTESTPSSTPGFESSYETSYEDQ
jgi:hypothetical protein